MTNTFSDARSNTGGSGVTLLWPAPGEDLRVRVLRSSEWYPMSPDPGMNVLFAAELIYEGHAATFTDSDPMHTGETYYSIFQESASGVWAPPRQFRVARDGGSRAVAGGGDPQTVPVFPRDGLGWILGVSFVLLSLATILVSGPALHVVGAALATVVTVWRLHDDAGRDLRRFARWAALPLVGSTLPVLVSALVGRSLAASGPAVPPLGLQLLWCAVVPLAGVGVWAYADYLMADRPHHARSVEVALLLALPAIAAAALPEWALFSAAVFGATAATVAFLRPHAEPVRGSGESEGGHFSFVCPRHGTTHTVVRNRDVVSSYSVAWDDVECLCPGRAPWFTRMGVHRVRALVWVLTAVWILNLLDLMLTWHSVGGGWAIEANGLMKPVLEAGRLPALVVKMGVATTGVIILWRLRHHRMILPVAAALAITYAGLIAYQTVGLINTILG